MRSFFRPAARDDLFALYAYVAGQAGLHLAGNCIDRIENFCLELGEMPHRGVPRGDLAPGIRTVSAERRAIIAHRVADQKVTIMRIFYAGRDYFADSFDE